MNKQSKQFGIFDYVPFFDFLNLTMKAAIDLIFRFNPINVSYSSQLLGIVMGQFDPLFYQF